MDGNGTVEQKLEAARHMLSDVAPLIEESRALSFALAAALASSPSGELSQNALDNLCQSAYELFRRHNLIKQIFDDALEQIHSVNKQHFG